MGTDRMSPPVMAMTVELVFSDDRSVFESPTWDAARKRLLFADLRTGTIFAYREGSGEIESWETGAIIGSFGICVSGRLIIAQDLSINLFDLDTGERTVLVEHVDDPPGNRFNDGKVGPDGCLWVGTRDGRRDQGKVPDGNGSLYRICPDGTVERKYTGYATSNGLAFTPDGHTMYYADSHNGRVDAWDVNPEKGEISGQRPFARPNTKQGRPDGATCDYRGHYWSAGVSAGCVNHFGLDGEIAEKYAMPCPKPTMTCFSEDYLYVTSMRDARGGTGIVMELQEADISHYPSNVTGLFRLPAPVAGAPTMLFDDRLFVEVQ
jgi:sugar lactone lactonase YvrE